MNQIRKQIAGLTAVLLFAGCITERLPVFTPKAALDSPLLRFARQAESVAAMPEDAFSVLQYDPSAQSLSADGHSAGNNTGGFCIVDGTLKLDAAAAGLTDTAERYLSLDDAKDAIGCEVFESDGQILVSSPFQSGTLIVSADGEIDSHGASAECSGYSGLHVMQYDSAAEAYQAYLAFSQDDRVQFAEPNRKFCLADNTDETGAEIIDGDWGYEAVGADEFRSTYVPEDAADVKVAVIDTGIYANHSWFKNRIAEGGASFVSINDGSVIDGQSHGTHCAGIICRQTNENVKILPLKALDDMGGGDTLGIYCAMMYAAEQKADVVSMSLGGVGISPLFEQAAAALNAAGISLIAAAGNDSFDAQYFHPAGIDSVITVSCVDQTDNGSYKLAYFSNYGDCIDFAAPGCNISSASISYPDGTEMKSGTSMACPMVAACFANLLSAKPTLTKEQIYEYLRTNTEDLGPVGFDSEYGWGMVQLRDFVFTNGKCKKPEASVRGGTYTEPFDITLETRTEGAEICYTTDGTIPTAQNSIHYDGKPITINEDTDLRAVAFKENSGSRMLHLKYEFSAAPPTAKPAGGIYDQAVDVTLSCDPNMQIYYTMDGSDPNSSPSAKLYESKAIHIAETTVIRAAARREKIYSPELRASYVIGGKDIDKIIHVEDGVLKSYSGSFETLDLTALLKDTKITEIADHAFADNSYLKTVILPDTVTRIGEQAFYHCPALTSVTGKGTASVGTEAFRECEALSEVNLPKLTVIGSGAFQNCTALSVPAWDWSAITEIHENAFSASAVSGDPELKSLKKIGAGAFAMTENLGSVTLPDSITAIPDRLFCYSHVQQVNAAGAVSVGAEAFRRDHTPIKTLNLAYDKIKSVDTKAFEDLVFSNADAVNLNFDALNTVGAYAFCGMQCNVLSLPALKQIPQYGLGMMAAKMVYLKSVETMEENAVSFSTFGNSGVVFGDQLKAFTGKEIEMASRAAVIAAPADSPAGHFFHARSIDNYIATPNLYIPYDNEIMIHMHEHRRMNIYPLGFGLTAQVSCNEKYEISRPDAYSFYPYDKEPCTVAYQIDGLDADGNVFTQKTLKIITGKIEVSDTPVICNQPHLMNFRASDNATLVYHFTAEQAGDYYVFCENSNAIVQYQRENEDAVQQQGNGFYPDDLIPVTMEKGETISIFANQSFMFNNQNALLMVTDVKPYNALADAPVSINQIFAADQEITLEDLNISIEELEMDKQYTVLIDRPNEAVHICGIGLFCGEITINLQIYQPLPNTRNVEVSFNEYGSVLYRFTPEKDGVYYFTTDLTDEAFAELQKDPMCAKNLEKLTLDMCIFDSKWNMIESPAANYDLLPVKECEMEANTPYYIRLESYGTLSAVQLNVFYGQMQNCIAQAETDLAYFQQYEFKPFLPDPTVTLNSRKLRANIDYDIMYANHELPGTMILIMRGKGDYFGLFREYINLGIAFSDLPDDLPVIQNETPFSQTAQLGIYKMECSESCNKYLKADNDCFWKAVMMQYKPLMDSQWDIMPDQYFNRDNQSGMYCEPGVYYVMIWKDTEEPVSFTLSNPQSNINLSLADVQCETLTYTGEILLPKLSVTLNGKALKEGVDYCIFEHPPIIECGSYTLELVGLGSYYGSIETNVRVVPDAANEPPLMTDGDQNITISKAGETMLYRWIPAYSNYCISKDFLKDAEITVINRNGQNVCSVSGVGFQFSDLNVTLRAVYYIKVRFYDPQMTGSIPFRLIPNGKLLRQCTVSAPKMIPAHTLSGMPEYEIYDGEKLLKAEQDYTAYWHGPEGKYGTGKIVLKGIGQYTGTLEYSYLVYPTLEEVLTLAVYDELPSDNLRSYDCFCPGHQRRMTFTATNSGVYHLVLPKSEECGASAVVYLPDGTVLPQDQTTITLSVNQTLNIFCMTDWLEADSVFNPEYSLLITRWPESGTYESNGYIYELSFAEAKLTQIPAGLQGIRLENGITLEGEEIYFSFGGINDPNLLEYIIQNCTVYCEKDSSIARYCSSVGICYAYIDAECTVKGDITGDGSVDRNDIMTLMRWLDAAEGISLSASAYQAADLDGDGAVTMQDLAAMRNLAA